MTDNPGFGTSDFMSRLVSRAAGKVLAIEPRLPSLFEPNQAETASSDLPPDRSGTADDTAPVPMSAKAGSIPSQAEVRIQKQNEDGQLAATPAQTAMMNAAHRIDEIRGPEPRSPSADYTKVGSKARKTGGDAALQTTIAPEVQLTLPPQIAPNGRRGIEYLQQPSRRSSGNPVAQPRDGASLSVKYPAIESFEQAQPSRTARQPLSADQRIDSIPMPLATSGTAAGRQFVKGPDRRGRAETATAPETVEREAGRFAQFAAPHSATRWRPVPASAEIPAQPAAEPVINITIGRVEVRAAVSSAVQAPLPKRGAAPLSLDDYLQNRARGK
jgi:hypothetical protein